MTDTKQQAQPRAEDESLDDALRRARSETERLERQRTVLATAEAAALDALERRRAKAEDRAGVLAAELAKREATIAALEHGAAVSLGLARNLRKAAQLILRLLLAAVAMLGLLVMAATDGSLLLLVALALEVGAVWFLGDVVDRLEHRDG